MPEQYDNRGCSIADCARRFYAKGMCEMHYARVRRQGSPHIDKRRERRDPIAWFNKHSKKRDARGCWLWSGAKTDKGYGCMKIGTLNALAHRFSYANWKGHLNPGECVLHRCDNPACVNPDHLFAGTRTDNNLDKQIKGRGLKGSQMPFAKLNEQIVRSARASHSPTQDLADRYGVSKETMRLALNGTTWRHV